LAQAFAEAASMDKDNRACIKIAKKGIVKGRTRHIQFLYRFSPQAIKSGALTKSLSEVKFTKFATSILNQDTRLDQSGNVEEQTNAA
jgi:hypothetical protein